MLIGAGTCVRIPNADVRKIWTENIGLVRSAVHPLLHDGLGRAAAAGNILTYPAPAITLLPNTTGNCRSVQAGVTEIIITGHLRAVRACGRRQLTLRLERRQGLPGPFLIDQLKNPGLECLIECRADSEDCGSRGTLGGAGWRPSFRSGPGRQGSLRSCRDTGPTGHYLSGGSQSHSGRTAD